MAKHISSIVSAVFQPNPLYHFSSLFPMYHDPCLDYNQEMERSVLNGLTLLFLLLVLALSGCASQNQPETPPRSKPDTPTLKPTPTMCTGWSCTIEGVIFRGEALPGNELEDIFIEFRQISWCSPTAGIQTTRSGDDGNFSFDVYLHDTDSFVITASADSYQPAQVKLGGFDCLYCACPPVEMILIPE